MDRDKRFEVTGMGQFFRKSILLFVETILDKKTGEKLDLDTMKPSDRGIVLFKSGTGLMRATITRIE
jgi:hypothetical protein